MALKYTLAENGIDDNDIERLIEWLLKREQLTQGKLTVEFEEQWARWIGTNYAVFCNSGSSANLLMVYAALVSGKLRNKKAIVPSVGWATTISPFIQFGFEPIMCGADPDHFGMELEYLETLCKNHDPALVMMVQVLGVPGNMADLLYLKAKYNFLLLEDACAAAGAEYNGRKVGSFGDMASFSFYYGHQYPTIEGGMVNTDNKELYELLLMLRSHGWGKDLPVETRASLMQKYKVDAFHQPFTFFVPGFNVRSTDLNAFLGLQQMKKVEIISTLRTLNHFYYMVSLDHVTYQKTSDYAKICSISFGAIARDTLHRKKIVQALDDNGIETRLFSAGNLGRHPFWILRYPEFRHPVADKIHQCGFFLPNHESLKGSDISFICDVVNSVG